MPKPSKHNITYYINTALLNSSEHSQDPRVWVVSIDRDQWRQMRRNYESQGIFLKRVSRRNANIKCPKIAVIIDSPSHARVASYVTSL